MQEDRAAQLSCYDCGAPFDPDRGVFSCNSQSGEGITIVTEAQMAEGEQVALSRRVYLDESRTTAIPEEAGEGDIAAWLYGVVGTLKSKAEALRLGLKDGVDFGEAIDQRIAIAQQEMANRATMRRSDATMIMPAAAQGESTPLRDEFSRETGGPLDEEAAAAPAAGDPSPMPQRASGGATSAKK